jgi:hypothetical protein
MKKIGIIASFVVLLVLTNSFALKKVIPLNWKPSDDITSLGTITLGKLSSLKVMVKNIVDERSIKTEIGKNIEEEGIEKYYVTNDNVSTWATDKLTSLLKQIGIAIVKENPDIIIEAKLIRFYVTESSTYKGEVSFNFTVSTKDGQNIWNGIISGKSNRWGRSFKAENYQECISNAFVQAVFNLFKEESFISAINKL